MKRLLKLPLDYEGEVYVNPEHIASIQRGDSETTWRTHSYLYMAGNPNLWVIALPVGELIDLVNGRLEEDT